MVPSVLHQPGPVLDSLFAQTVRVQKCTDDLYKLRLELWPLCGLAAASENTVSVSAAERSRQS